jgi:hypothetical protein
MPDFHAAPIVGIQNAKRKGYRNHHRDCGSTGIRFMYGSVSSSTKARMSHVGSRIVCRVAHTTIVIPSRMANANRAYDDWVLSISTKNMAIVDVAMRINARLEGIPDPLVAP